MSKLTQLIEELCPEGVEYRKLGELGTRNKGIVITASTMKELHREGGEVRVFAGGHTIADVDRADLPSTAVIDVPSIIVKSRGHIGFEYHTRPFTHKSELWSYTLNDPDIDQKFVFYYLQSQVRYFQIKAKSGKLPQIGVRDTDHFPVPVPPLEAQQEIVRVLDAFTDLEQNLAAELELRQKQFEEYRLQAFGKLDADYVGLQSIATIGTGSRNTNEAVDKGAYPFYTRGEEVLFSDEYDFDETSIITAGDGVGVGKTMHFASGKFALHQRAYRINITNSCVEPRFVFHLMKATFLNYMIRNSVHASVTSVRKRMLDDFPVPVLATEVQQDIVSKLDAFESLIQSIEQEIALRRKQYEFYRDELLTFKSKEA